MSRPKSNGPYAPLGAKYYFDDAILEAGEQAELLFVRCLAFLAEASSDGFITERQMVSAVGVGLRGVPKRVSRLLEVGLLERVDGGFVARSWLKWNKSTEDIGKYLKRDRERKARNHAGVAPNSGRNPTGIPPDSAPQITTHHITTKQSNTYVAENRADVESLCALLAELVTANGSKPPTVTPKWRAEARLMLDKDGRELQAAARLIRWSQADTFWKGNVLSMPTFRAKYDQLRLAANRELEDRKAQKPTAAQRNLSTVEYFAQQQREVEA
jgi:hypothetical protein